MCHVAYDQNCTTTIRLLCIIKILIAEHLIRLSLHLVIDENVDCCIGYSVLEQLKIVFIISTVLYFICSSQSQRSTSNWLVLAIRPIATGGIRGQCFPQFFVPPQILLCSENVLLKHIIKAKTLPP